MASYFGLWKAALRLILPLPTIRRSASYLETRPSAVNQPIDNVLTWRFLIEIEIELKFTDSAAAGLGV